MMACSSQTATHPGDGSERTNQAEITDHLAGGKREM